VLDVAAAGPVAEADVQRGDVVVALDGEPIAGVDDMHRSLTAERAGRALTLTLLRRAERLEVSVIPGEA
jgi:S1-C subfamily serine protease